MEPKNLTGNYGPNFLKAQVKGAQKPSPPDFGQEKWEA